MRTSLPVPVSQIFLEPRSEWRRLQNHPSPDYAFAPDDEEAVAPAWPVDVRRYPWAAANEPDEGQTANAAFVYWPAAWQVVEGAPKRVKVVAYAIHAHRRLRPGEEVTVHYGDGYEWVRKRKGYAAGNGVVVDRGSIAADERPAAHLGRRVPRTAMARRR